MPGDHENAEKTTAHSEYMVPQVNWLWLGTMTLKVANNASDELLFQMNTSGKRRCSSQVFNRIIGSKQCILYSAMIQHLL